MLLSTRCGCYEILFHEAHGVYAMRTPKGSWVRVRPGDEVLCAIVGGVCFKPLLAETFDYELYEILISAQTEHEPWCQEMEGLMEQLGYL